jgi:hypothetical protein
LIHHHHDKAKKNSNTTTITISNGETGDERTPTPLVMIAEIHLCTGYHPLGGPFTIIFDDDDGTCY